MLDNFCQSHNWPTTHYVGIIVMQYLHDILQKYEFSINMDAVSVWMQYQYGCSINMDAVSIWMQYQYGCSINMDVVSIWMQYRYAYCNLLFIYLFIL